VSACFSNLPIVRIPIAEKSLIESAASQNVLQVGLAHTAARGIPVSLKAQWSTILQADGILNQRQSYQPQGEYEGIIRDDSLKNELNGS
jgi:hypothetical protein